MWKMTSCNLLRSFFALQKLPRIPFNKGVNKSELSSTVNVSQIISSSSRNCTPNNVNQYRMFASSTSTIDVIKAEKEVSRGHKKPKTLEVPKIMLLSETGSISIVTIEEATKIAKKKSLKIKEIENPKEIIKTDKKVYKLVSTAQLLNENDMTKSPDNNKEKSKDKDIKTLILKSTTSDNDTISKVKSVKKWIEKGHTVRVFIGIGVKGNAEHVYDVIQEGLKDVQVRIIQKVLKGNEMRFQVMPPKEIKPKKSKNSEEIKAEDDV